MLKEIPILHWLAQHIMRWKWPSLGIKSEGGSGAGRRKWFFAEPLCLPGLAWTARVLISNHPRDVPAAEEGGEREAGLQRVSNSKVPRAYQTLSSLPFARVPSTGCSRCCSVCTGRGQCRCLNRTPSHTLWRAGISIKERGVDKVVVDTRVGDLCHLQTVWVKGQILSYRHDL